MIITEQKEFDEILRSLEGHKRVFLIGCGICATTWGTGGEKETREMAERLAEAGKNCTGWIVTEEATCDVRTTRRLLKQNKESSLAPAPATGGGWGGADALLVLSCGAGVQTVASLIDVPVYPALNTLFLARLQSLSVCDERCRLCGACILGETAAICPVTLCPKGLMNGPCGGYEDGKCEVDRERDCAWVAIYERMEALGQQERFKITHEPKDWREDRHPGFINKRAEKALG
ncbi:MAG: methylenetetrahydrofolate reductase C-terminal domain-containing protein [Anaerolineae bacterium]